MDFFWRPAGLEHWHLASASKASFAKSSHTSSFEADSGNSLNCCLKSVYQFQLIAMFHTVPLTTELWYFSSAFRYLEAQVEASELEIGA